MTHEDPDAPGDRDAATPALIADRIVDAIERNDMEVVRAIYADDVRIWHSFDGLTQTKDEGIMLLSLIARLGTARYKVLDRICSGERVAQRHELTITSHDGSRLYSLPAALFATMRGGRLVAIDEYVDSERVAAFMAALEQAREADLPS